MQDVINDRLCVNALKLLACIKGVFGRLSPHLPSVQFVIRCACQAPGGWRVEGTIFDGTVEVAGGGEWGWARLRSASNACGVGLASGVRL